MIRRFLTVEPVRLLVRAIQDSTVLRAAGSFGNGFAEVFQRIWWGIPIDKLYRLVEWMEPHTDTNLSIRAGEHKILEIKKHWAASIWSVIKIVLASWLWLWATFADLQWGVVDFYWIFFMPFALSIIIGGVWHIVGEFRDRFVITNQRIFRINGVVGKTRASIPIGRILDITAKHSAIATILHLNFGHFVFESAAQIQGLNEITYVRDIDENEEILRMAIHGDEPHELSMITNEEDDGT